MGQPEDRRRHVRHLVESPCKVVELKTGRSLPGRTRDVSLGGLQVTLRTPVELAVGDRLRIGVAWRGQAIIDEALMSEVEVVRCGPWYNGQQTLAIRRIDAATGAKQAA